MKISNEAKIGAIAILSLAILIIGFNFLKGKKLFSNATTLYAKFGNVQGLQNSNPIMANGMQIGTVYNISTDKNLRRILVEMNITEDVNLPKNSIAIIKNNPLGTPSIELKLGDSPNFLVNKDTVITDASGGVFDEMLKKVDPVLFEVRKAVTSLDTLINNFNSVLDPNTKGNLSGSIANLEQLTRSLTYSSASLNQMLNQQTGALAKSLNNMSSITGNIANQNEKIASVVTNLDKTTTNISQLDLQQTLSQMNGTINELKNTIARMNSNDGSLGMLMNDTRLYNNLASTGNKLNLLLDDIRTNPKRYISISVFGKKNNTKPLEVPLPDTLNAPYYIEKVKLN